MTSRARNWMQAAESIGIHGSIKACQASNFGHAGYAQTHTIRRH
jgi:hypothetical protein